MFIHHFFGFPNDLLPETKWTPIFSVHGYSPEWLVAHFGKICVSLFAFNSGYALWVNRERSGKPSSCAVRLYNFMASIFIVSLLFIAVALLMGDPIPSLSDYLLNLMGLQQSIYLPWVNIPSAWYVTYYILFLIVSPLLLIVFRSDSKRRDIYGIVAVALLATAAYISIAMGEVVVCLIPSVAGILCAKYRLFNKMEEKFKKYSTTIIIALLCLMPVIRYVIFCLICYIFRGVDIMPRTVDAVMAVIIIFLFITLRKRYQGKYQIGKYLEKLGDHSMNLWYMHGIFLLSTVCVLQPILYAANFSVLIVIWCIIMLLPISMIITPIQNAIHIKRLPFVNISGKVVGEKNHNFKD